MVPELSGLRGPALILVVDDDEVTLILSRALLTAEGYDVVTAVNIQEAQRLVEERRPDLILTDVVMPRGSGIELCQILKEDPQTRLIPVILVTGLSDRESKLRGIEAGADDFLSKPLDPQELFARVHSLLKLKQFTDELENAETVLTSLALGVEARDPYTVGHCDRLSRSAAALGRRLGLPEPDVTALRRSGILHDIGKIGVPDAILKKPGGLAPHEWEIMRQHPVVGEQICHPLRSLRRVLPIIRHHHEHWNGGGYPDGLAGDAIPLLARVLQVADAYDALTTDRPYKPALGHTEASAILRRESEQGWWDRHLIDALLLMIENTAA
ncbi:MAG: HD-GYP domain-containing protein [Terriglobales bacterium]